MQIKTNIRAGSGSANSGGVNAKHSSDASVPVIATRAPPPAPVVYYPPVGRCVGY